MKVILAKKIGMTNRFSDRGDIIPITLLEAGPCVVTQVKTEEKDGYNAIQIGFGEAKKLKKPQKGHLGKEKLKYLQEIRTEEKNMKVGDKFTCSIFNEGDKVHVVGKSKGKGFAGVIKRHNFSRGPETHGSRHHRKPGSIGGMFPQHVFKGTKLPGRMGGEQVTVKNLNIDSVDAKNNILAIKGAVPGPKKSVILIKETV